MDDKKENGLGRRGFLGAAMLGMGGVGGWAIGKFRKGDGNPKRQLKRGPRTPLGKAYDIDRYRFVDPARITFEPAGEFETGLEKVSALELSAEGSLLVGGDKEIRSFDRQGQSLGSMGLSQSPHCLHVAASGELFIGMARHFEVHSAEGERLERTETFSARSFITSMTTIGERVFVADAGNREVLICDRKGFVQKRFGQVPEGKVDQPEDQEGEQGFAVPSPYFAIRSNPQGDLWVTNPGHLRVESYSQEGEFLSSWGTNGMQLEDFTGCCNPVYMALLPGGGFVTSEKGLFRIKTYDMQGDLQGVVAGPKALVPDERVAKLARSRGRGTGFAVVAAEDGAIYALDPFRKSVRIFKPLV